MVGYAVCYKSDFNFRRVVFFSGILVPRSLFVQEVSRFNVS